MADRSEPVNPPRLGWRRSSFCSNDTCVEVSLEIAGVHIRSSKDPKTEIAITHREWQAFLAGIKNFEFELPDPSRTDGFK